MEPPLTSTPNDKSRRRRSRTPKSTPVKLESERQKHTPQSTKRKLSKQTQEKHSAVDVTEHDVTIPLTTDIAAVKALKEMVEQRRKQGRKSKPTTSQEKIKPVREGSPLKQPNIKEISASKCNAFPPDVSLSSRDADKALSALKGEDVNANENENHVNNANIHIGNETRVPDEKLITACSSDIPVDIIQEDMKQIDSKGLTEETPKRKRGRPRKSLNNSVLPEENIIHQDNSLTNTDSAVGLDIGNKKRGRKSDVSVSNAGEKSAELERDSIDTAAMVANDGVERQPNIVINSGTVTPVSDDKYFYQNNTLDKTEHVIVKKRRGRPSKQASKSVSNEEHPPHDSNETLDEDMANDSRSTDARSTSRSGRKRKQINYSALGESDFEDSDESLDEDMANKSRSTEVRSTSRSGRKRKQINYSTLDESGLGESDGEVVKRRKRKQTDYADGGDEDDESTEVKTPVKGKGSKGRGRKQKEADGSPQAESKTGSKAVIQCQRCDYTCSVGRSMENHMAIYHQALWSREHPEGLEDNKSLVTIIKLKKFLNCPRCDKRINFIQYYRKHIEWCGREMETYTCSICGHGNLQLQWKDMHDLACQRKLAQLAEQAEQRARRKEKSTEVATDGKRSAAKRAKSMLKNLSKDLNPGEYSDDSVGDPSVSIDQDASETDDYINPGEELDEELDYDSFEDGSDDDGGSIGGGKMGQSINYPRGLGSYMNSYPVMEEVVATKFSKELYPNLLPWKHNWHLVPENEVGQYKPKPGPSIGFKFGSEKSQMHNLNLYEAKLVNEFPIFYTGLSVWQLAWCPVPVDTATDQFLAVTGKLDHDKQVEVYNYHVGPGVIQIWNMGVSSNKMKVDQLPCLVYSIAHDYGHVTSMQWCQSGCWQSAQSQTDSHYSRLGLLALSFTDGTVRIISVPRLEDTTDEAPFYRTEPAVTLVPHRSPETLSVTCSCLAWKPTDGHTIIMTGYSDGSVRLFNLTTESPLLILSTSPHRTLVPYHSFHAHIAVVRCCGWTSVFDNKVVTAGDDILIHWWDLDNTRCPRNVDNSRIYQPVRFACPLIHHGVCVSTDDSHSFHMNRSFYQESEIIKYVTQGDCWGQRKSLVPITLFLQNGCGWGADFSDWLNFVFTCDSRGQVMGLGLLDVVMCSSDSYRATNRLKLLKTELREINDTDELSLDTSRSETVDKCLCNTHQSETCKHCANNQSCHPKQMTSETIVQPEPLAQNNRTSGETSSQSEDVLQNSCDRTKVNSPVEESKETCATKVRDKTTDSIADKPTSEIGSYSEMVDNKCLLFTEYMKERNIGSHNTDPRDEYDRFPITSWNALAINPNSHTCYWLAFGGESGLVRVVNINKLRPRALIAYMDYTRHKKHSWSSEQNIGK